MSLLYAMQYTSAHVVRFGDSACTPNKGSSVRDCLIALNSGVGVGVGVTQLDMHVVV